MFLHKGPNRDPAKNRRLAAYLALTAGYVNSSGYVIIGSFTSHVTGSVGRLGNDIARWDIDAGIFAMLLVVAFFVGSFAASLVVDTKLRAVSQSYAWALLFEAACLAFFVVLAAFGTSRSARVLDAEAAILCFAMGMQNSLVTSLSGSVVRTTHLTGVVTDLGIEAARWSLWYRAKMNWPVLLPGRRESERPSPVKAKLLSTIVAAFVTGAVTGAALTLRTNAWAMMVPVLLIFAASVYAFVQKGN